MKRLIAIMWVLLAVAVGLLAWIRLAPSDPARWHVRPEFTADRDMPGGAVRIIRAGPDALARLDRIARATPRTRLLAGSVEEGMMTWITRSRAFGFPDYTTAWADGERLVIYARLRFGRADFGVNRARVEGWVRALQAR